MRRQRRHALLAQRGIRCRALAARRRIAVLLRLLYSLLWISSGTAGMACICLLFCLIFPPLGHARHRQDGVTVGQAGCQAHTTPCTQLHYTLHARMACHTRAAAERARKEDRGGRKEEGRLARCWRLLRHGVPACLGAHTPFILPTHAFFCSIRPSLCFLLWLCWITRWTTFAILYCRLSYYSHTIFYCMLYICVAWFSVTCTLPWRVAYGLCTQRSQLPLLPTLLPFFSRLFLPMWLSPFWFSRICRVCPHLDGSVILPSDSFLTFFVDAYLPLHVSLFILMSVLGR